MDNINVLIIEDTPEQSDALVKVLLENNYNIAGVAVNFTDALKLFYETVVDVIIIDVFLDGKPDGITFAESINIIPQASKPFVFLTSSQDRQIFERAKLTRPFSFLMKPFNELEILYAIEMAVEKFYEQTNVFLSEEQNTVISNDSLFIKKKNSLKKVALEDILYIEVEERYCNIITEKEKFVILISLTKISELLDKNKFIKTHRNTIVNSAKIEEIFLTDNLIILKGNHRINLSDTYKDFIKNMNILS
ncbi:LytR/AlgR family response regulator transcription factor [Flavobacterium johnsoniae]|jgi:DNA-binding LytR/AlgR family response regulator|uniref:Two component transcriptional regulator, LytTR family n=1 Tax=Flavobacterium johnsoniae (strain ATCC 17061 / DSM 2064 / JCM 8514 / BCRC 14874 / CCUG 350202 / NBRC 14942 / NCIMB 11054 / UW101) TaxID=376686 RepID=A5FK01_FLAJ1|nr:response regulator transcription factor [Flavobacterium johnsoniae]ABQ04473.1 two component transcriptional regulator, LytTR family [Flavobacterium johnsoniae UW101]OXE97799.1 DNA-binding response regulator [Flavobacterium johnsoniae UW101]WQG83731.1 response regulator transcription factor [Flavobacterium johnsoniae UW101]SHK23378.1 two component transcriptional regulator, LytTR family [Flavobacterium johnsoniae]